jgi:small conductance mechanosensitive channel
MFPVLPPLAAGPGCAPSQLLTGVCKTIQDRGFPGSDVLGVAVQDLLQGVIVFAIVVAVGRFLRRLTIRALTRANADPQLRTLINNVFMITTLAVAAFSGLTAGGLDIKVLLTFGGLASLSLGLAFQDLLRNVLAGIFLLLERPFRIGDWITAGDLSGSVQTIQLRTTALRTADGRLAILPNMTAFNTAIVNATAYDMRQYSAAVRLPPGADLAGAMGKVRGVAEGTQGVLAEPRPFVQPRLDADGGVTISCRYWVQYRSHDPDALAATLVAGIYEALGPWPAVTADAPSTPPGTAAADTPPAGDKK